MPDFGKYKVKRKFSEDIEPEEILMDSRRLKESPEGEREKLEKPIKESILKIFLISIIVILAILLTKSFHLQIIKGDYWQGLADENRIRSYPIRPLRGIIYDKNKIPLAINVPNLDLVVIPADFFGDVIGDLSARRGKIEETQDRLQMKVIDAKVPLSEMFGYATAIRSLTEGRGTFTMEFDHYDEVPGNIAQEIIEGKRR